MSTRAILLAVLVTASSIGAQPPHPRHFGLGFRIPIGRAPAGAPTCDHAPFQRVEDRKRLGTVLLWGGAAAVAGGSYAVESNGSSGGIPIITGGLVTAFVGGYIKNSADDPDAVDQAVQSLKIGETRASDVVACMGRPRTTTTRNSTDETWTYTMTKAHSKGGPAIYFVPIVGSLFAGSGSTEMRSVTLTFRDGLLTDVSKTAAGF